MMNNLAFIGFIFIILGIILIITAALHQKSETKVAIGGFIGTIPFGFGDKEMLKWIIAIVAIVAIVSLILILRGFVP